jgi:hypothetical protein
MLDKLTDVTEVGVGSWLYEAGRSNEDNTPFIGVCLYLEAETPDGFRWRHNHNFNSGRVEEEEGWNFFVFDNEKDGRESEALCAKVQAHLSKGGQLDPNCWDSIQGRYCSQGWDEMAEIEHERRVEEESHWR